MIKMMNMAASGGKNMMSGVYHLLCICARSTHYIVRLFATCVWKLLQAQGRRVLALVRKVPGRPLLEDDDDDDDDDDKEGGKEGGASTGKTQLKAQLELVSEAAFGDAGDEVLEEEDEVKVSPLLRQAKLLEEREKNERPRGEAGDEVLEEEDEVKVSPLLRQEKNERPRGDSPPKTGVGSTVVSFDKGAHLGFVVEDGGRMWMLNTGKGVVKSSLGKKGGWQWKAKAQLVSPRVSPVPKALPQHLQRHVVCNAQAALDLLMKMQQAGMTVPLHITVT